MKEIPLSNGMVVFVDDIDYPHLSLYRWFASGGRNTTYAAFHPPNTHKGVPSVRMHTLLMNPQKGFQVDHIDGNGLNNQRDNLRIVSVRENHWNYHNVKKTSKFPGVCSKGNNRWVSSIRIDGKVKHLGYFETEESAFKKYCDTLIELGYSVPNCDCSAGGGE